MKIKCVLLLCLLLILPSSIMADRIREYIVEPGSWDYFPIHAGADEWYREAYRFWDGTSANASYIAWAVCNPRFRYTDITKDGHEVKLIKIRYKNKGHNHHFFISNKNRLTRIYEPNSGHRYGRYWNMTTTEANPNHRSPDLPRNYGFFVDGLIMLDPEKLSNPDGPTKQFKSKVMSSYELSHYAVGGDNYIQICNRLGTHRVGKVVVRVTTTEMPIAAIKLTRTFYGIQFLGLKAPKTIRFKVQDPNENVVHTITKSVPDTDVIRTFDFNVADSFEYDEYAKHKYYWEMVWNDGTITTTKKRTLKKDTSTTDPDDHTTGKTGTQIFFSKLQKIK